MILQSDTMNGWEALVLGGAHPGHLLLQVEKRRRLMPPEKDCLERYGCMPDLWTAVIVAIALACLVMLFLAALGVKT